jgi:hypothetical protein
MFPFLNTIDIRSCRCNFNANCMFPFLNTIDIRSCRCNFKAYCMFSFLNTIVYCVPAGWAWGDHGFLRRLGYVDIAGSGPVHLIGGSSGELFGM